MDDFPNLTELVKEFQIRFDEHYDGPPRSLPKEFNYRYGHMINELIEYEQALKKDDIVEQYDGLLDLLYLVVGTMILQGFPLPEGFIMVHMSNMTKEVVAKGKGKYGGRVHKGKDFIDPKPALTRIIQQLIMTKKAESNDQT